MASIQDTDLLLINRGGADFQAQVSELPPGPIGPPGTDGTAATVSVGTTTTSAPGTDASVINSGDTTAAVFEFTIPRGDKGDKGDTGTSVSFQGTIDLTADSVPLSPAIGDLYINTESGTMSAAWQTATGEGAISVASGDDVVFNNSSQWSYVPSGTAEVPTDLDIDNRGTETLDITSSTGDDVTIPAATDLLAGLMTAADKVTLDSGGTPNGGTGDRPTSPDTGDLYFDTDLELLLVWNGTDWEPVSPPTEPGQWQRNGSKLTPFNNGDTVAVTAADGTENITLNANGMAEFADNILIGGTLPSSPNITLNASGDVELAGDITNTTVDGDQDIICDGAGLIKLTEYNLNPMEVVTKHDIGTGANEVPVNGFLGTLAYKDDLAIQDGTTVASLPTSPTAKVGNITRVTDGAAALTWGATVTGGGTAQYLVWYNGTNWTVFGA